MLGTKPTYMKKLLLLAAAFAVMTSSFASVTPTTDLPKNASQMFMPIGKTGQSISLKDLAEISVADYEKLSGKEMKFMQKLAFKKGQKKLKKSMNADGTLTEKGAKRLAPYFAGETGVHLGGLALGFFLGFIGILLAYVAFDDDYKKNRIKWAWIGLGLSVVLYIVLFAIVFSSVDTTP